MGPPRVQRNVASRYSKHSKDPKEQFKRRGADLIRKVADKDRYGIFLDPVDVNAVPGYAEMITRPMDISTLSRNLHLGMYRTPAELYADLELIWSNCCSFNGDTTVFFREAVRLRALSARFYGDFVRLLERDGIAEALGVSSQTYSQDHPSTRVALKRPPRYPQNHTRPSSNAIATPVQTPLSPNEVHTDVPDILPSTPSMNGASSSATSAAARHSYLRRKQADHEAAVHSLRLAEEEVKLAAQKADVVLGDNDDDGSSHGTPGLLKFYRGPSDVLQKHPDGRPVLEKPEQYAFMSKERTMLRCSNVPLSWRRIGRWHPPGSTSTKFLSEERACDVFYGKKFDGYVRRTAPVACRLLATILDPDIVEAHDEAVINQASLELRASASEKKVSANSYEGNTSQNHSNPEDISGSVSGRKRPRSKTSDKESSCNGKVESLKEDSETGRFLASILGLERVRKAARSDEPAPKMSEASPNKHSLNKMRSLLKLKGVDTSFINELISTDQHGPQKDVPVTNPTRDKGTESMPIDELKGLLNANYEAMQNTLRLRALRDYVNEAEREDVEDRERECAEAVAKGVARAVRQLQPRFFVHPLDAAECARELCGSMSDPTESNEK